ncbi:MAG: TraR/DksA family transcriptional regulator [Planctomycetaceae bacterium]|nr:TraR/DksA family transcriptional regulator [Planctomycetaceae bacterium]
MTPERRRIYKNRLLNMRAQLRGDVSRMVSSALSAGDDGARQNRMPIHMAEMAGDHFEQELSLTLASSKDGTLQKIERALERIEDGTYGVCDGCGRKILQARLDAIPYADLCVPCARLDEDTANQGWDEEEL